jgi:multiple sugar transport system permease protein
MFAANALINFCNFATLACLLVTVLGSLISFLPKPKARKTGLLLSAVFGTVLYALNLVILLRVSGANAAILRLSYGGLGMRYLYPAGAVILAGLGFAELLMYLAYRRLFLKHEKLYIPMTRNERRENLKGFAFISPYLVGFGLFTAFPMIFSMFTSFTYYNITAVQKWYGLNNYIALFTQDDMFFKSLGNTLFYVAFSVPLVIAVAMILALLMNMRVKFMSFFRTIYYLPSVLSGVAVFLLWQWIFDPTSGLLNNAIGMLGVKGPAWLYDASWTKPALIVMRLWSTGGTMILLLAALQGVPTDLYEAGELDGAVGFKKFRHITLPMISPTLFFVMVTGISGAFQVYDSAYIMVENGGPGKSLMFYNLYLFLTAFKDQSMGKASSMAWILFAIIMIFTLIQMAASKRWVHYEGGTDK